MDRFKINKILFDLESGYDQIADKFSGTRKFFWRDLESVADYVENGDTVLDYGCGNGRLLDILNNKNIDYQGVDTSGELITLARKRYPELASKFTKISVQPSLPFNSDYFNKIISIAVFHHFPVPYAEDMAQELYRITKPGGKIIITAWNLWQPRFRKNIWSWKVLSQKLFQKGDYNGLGFKDIYIPFKNNNGDVFNRYHHAYTKKDLEKIFLEAGFKTEKCEIVSRKNILYTGRK